LPERAFFTTRFRAAGFVAGFRAALARFVAGAAFFPAAGFLAGFRAFAAGDFFAAAAVDFRAAPGRFFATGLRAFTDLRTVFVAGMSLPRSG